MIPLFFSANPSSILVRDKTYRFVCFLAFEEERDLDFRNRLRRAYRDLHEDTGKNCAVVDFAFPPRDWLEKYLGWFLERYGLMGKHENAKASIDLLRQEGLDAYDLLADEYERNGGWESRHVRDVFMRMMHLASDKLPALVVFDRSDKNRFGLATSATFDDVAQILERLVVRQNLNGDSVLDVMLLQQQVLIDEIVAPISNPLSAGFATVADKVMQSMAMKQDQEIQLDPLIAEFPDFARLESPEKFSWRPSLRKCLARHREHVSRYVEKLNMLSNQPNMPGLGLERIGDFWRFRVNDFYRAHYHLIDGKRIHYFFGEHDYQL